MDIKNAQKNFQEILKVEQSNWRAQSFLALAYMLSVLQDMGSSDEKRKAFQKAAELAQEVLEKSDAQSTRQLAQSILDWEKELQQRAETKPGPL